MIILLYYVLFKNVCYFVENSTPVVDTGFTYTLYNISDKDECRQNPCYNGGICTNTVGSFSCRCAPGWTGPTCLLGNELAS